MSHLLAENVHVRLGDRQVLSGVSASFAPAQVTAIVGPNGAGKSTLLSCLAGLRAPDQGIVKLGDDALMQLPPRVRAQRIGFLPQIPEVAWAVDARTLVGLGRTPFIGARGLSSEDDAAVDDALTITNTLDLAHRNVMTLSGGERGRVLIARALAGKPKWLLADEPLTGLDPGFQLDAADLFRKLAHHDGCGVIITLHDLHMALRVADRILVLGAGRILADGNPVEALTPAILKQAYGIEALIKQGSHGPLIEILRRT
jgi:iron complex transport system ATP-binding protein